MTTKWSKVSVVMSNYNGLKLNLLMESLSSILTNDYSNLEVILVDNASTDDSVRVVKRRFAKFSNLKIVQNPVNMYSQGLNLGIEEASGKYIAFFNNDVVVENGYFQKFVRFLDKNLKIALSQGKLLSYFDHTIIDSTGETMDAFGTPITIGAGMPAEGNFDQVREVLSVSGSCSILRKSKVSNIGLFDEDYGIGFEDLDLALRIWLKGYKVVYFPNVFAYHKRGATDLSPMVRNKVRWHFNKNRIATILKNYPLGFIIKNLPITIFIYFAAGVWEILIKRQLKLGLTRFSCLYWILLNLKNIIKKRNEVQLKANEFGKHKIQRLLYTKSILNSFNSFIKAK